MLVLLLVITICVVIGILYYRYVKGLNNRTREKQKSGKYDKPKRGGF